MSQDKQSSSAEIKKDSKVFISCLRFSSDWTHDENVEIDLDKWVFFEVDYRGENSWHLIGHRVKDQKEYKWETEELSIHGVFGIVSMAKFITEANAYKSGKHQPCRVSRFNNLHYYDSFYGELSKLLEMVNKTAKAI